MGGQSDFGKNPYAAMGAIPGYQRQMDPGGQAYAPGSASMGSMIGGPQAQGFGDAMRANMGGMMGAPQAQSFGDAMRARMAGMGGQFDSGMYGGNVAADPAMGQAAMAGAAGGRVTPDMIAAHRAAAMAGTAPGGMMGQPAIGQAAMAGAGGSPELLAAKRAALMGQMGPGSPLMSPMQAALPGMRRGQEMYGMRGPVIGRPGYGR